MRSVMRHETPLMNSFYNSMVHEAEAINKDDSAECSGVPFGVLYKFWREGAFDEYSDDHFLIRAFNNDIEYFKSLALRG